jgi:GDP-4-dehydro-6-deoxy-D-mannose reductase
MRVLITGITGFVGSYLAEALLAQGGVELFGISRRGEWSADCRHLAGGVTLFACDLGDSVGLDRCLRDVRPQQIHHLGGYAHVGKSLREPRAAWDGNLTATLALYDAVCRWGGKPRILHVSSGMVYGQPTPPRQLLDENSPMEPSTPYAASKAAADLAACQYHLALGLEIVRVRPFNHIGPRQSPEYAVSSFARQTAEILAKKRPAVIDTGDLSSQRDLTDVRDMVQAYLRLMECGRPGAVYNAGSGQAHSIQAVLERLIALAGVQAEVRSCTVEHRQADPAVLRADSSKLEQETGWKPALPLDRTLTDILDYWRTRT